MKKPVFLTFLAILIIMCISLFRYADSMRIEPATGGEVFLIALPIYLIWKYLTVQGK